MLKKIKTMKIHIEGLTKAMITKYNYDTLYIGPFDWSTKYGLEDAKIRVQCHISSYNYT